MWYLAIWVNFDRGCLLPFDYLIIHKTVFPVPLKLSILLPAGKYDAAPHVRWWILQKRKQGRGEFLECLYLLPPRSALIIKSMQNYARRENIMVSQMSNIKMIIMMEEEM